MQSLWHWELSGANNFVCEKQQEDDTALDEDGQPRHRQVLGRLLWLDRPDIMNAVCQLLTHIGTATSRDEASVHQLPRYLVGNPQCLKIERCILDVWGAAGIPLGSGFVMTDADWAGGVKHRPSYSGIAVWVKSSTMKARCPVYASSKTQDMVCLSSGVAPLGGNRSSRPVVQDVWVRGWQDCLMH